MPRKEYKTITVKVETFHQFAKAVKKAKQEDPELDNSTFLMLLMGKSQKVKRHRS
ncbi:hypothetical protein [Candidatus Nitrosotalea okcheonensis]|uniref:Uncharacterized protein n=1 Tax=Candidatus Nitrosotalea okcheonensis TaxID=1903276 RepID=A0A2H1FCE0_9ARCH|nr:hypothetical protein [Candidatus Nitrosotalea okcheonensis]MDE1728430.1 hypothetical protein [Nitrososphaerota archaeon]MDE1831239.1 hypothetical protein [Nitrososphaerota archaeon]MDE1841052.1 hypothetical protein [Nitrososphaerota archaeon]MDE1877174.1 hypothetical protein [Nitrososphaerota archaeon]SMH70428.1 protein of unknown function [Candidatus Nitrosotalea okcheonensis]